MSLGKALWQFRAAKGWTQKFLAEKAGVAQTALSAIERDEATNPMFDTIVRLAAALEVSLDILVFRSKSPVTRSLPPLPLEDTPHAP